MREQQPSNLRLRAVEYSAARNIFPTSIHTIYSDLSPSTNLFEMDELKTQMAKLESVLLGNPQSGTAN